MKSYFDAAAILAFKKTHLAHETSDIVTTTSTLCPSNVPFIVRVQSPILFFSFVDFSFEETFFNSTEFVEDPFLTFSVELFEFELVISEDELVFAKTIVTEKNIPKKSSFFIALNCLV